MRRGLFDMNRYDERDTLFSRMYELFPGSENYTLYYQNNPDLEDQDSRLRDSPPGVFSNRKYENAYIEGCYEYLKDLRQFTNNWNPGNNHITNNVVKNNIGNIQSSPLNNEHKTKNLTLTQNIKELEDFIIRIAKDRGAHDISIIPGPNEFAYTVRGRGQHYGEIVDREALLPNIIIYAVQMDAQEIQKAPAIEEAIEVVKTYVKIAEIGMTLTYFLRNQGFNAICHMDGESQYVLPPVAEKAGLGSIGAHGLLIHPKLGTAIRLGAVSTNAPLPVKKKDSEKFNHALFSFCRTCGKCADYCPASAIPNYSKNLHDLERKRIDHEACYEVWKRLGTDCGVCLAVCPFLHKPELKRQNSLKEGQGEFSLKKYMYGS